MDAEYNFDEILFASYAEADKLISNMQETITKYGKVSVADLYNFIGFVSSFTDERWGWVDLSAVEIKPLVASQKYLLNLPDPEPIRS